MKYWFLLVFLVLAVWSCGCLQTPDQVSDERVNTASDIGTEPVSPPERNTSPVTPEAVKNDSSTGSGINLEVNGTKMEEEPVYENLTDISPVPTRVIDTNSEFRNLVIPMIDLMQSAKSGLILIAESGDGDLIENKTRELSGIVRTNAVLKDVPKKMDYVKVNYHEYIDQLTQFVESYSSGAERLRSGDYASARSYFAAGNIASDRADIAVKRIETFFDDHLIY